MAWVRLEDNFPEHPKVATVGGDAGWLHVCAIAYCSRNLTDGFVPSGAIRQLSDRNKPNVLATRLVDAGLWELASNGYIIHDYLDYNPTRVEVEAERADRSVKKAEAGRLGGIASGVARRKHKRSKDEAEGQAEGNENVAPTRPDPFTYISDKTDDLLLGPLPSSSFSAEQHVAHQLARHQATAKPPEHIDRWLPATRKGILTERADDIARALTRCGGDPELAVVQLLTNPPQPVTREAWYSDPACDDCGGSGLISDETNTCSPCPCRRNTEYLATIHHLPGATA